MKYLSVNWNVWMMQRNDKDQIRSGHRDAIIAPLTRKKNNVKILYIYKYSAVQEG